MLFLNKTVIFLCFEAKFTVRIYREGILDQQFFRILYFLLLDNMFDQVARSLQIKLPSE